MKNNKLIKSDKYIRINLGGIAKGYIIDLVRDFLLENDIEHFVINEGGDIYLREKQNEDGWKIGIRHPRKKGELFANVTVKDKAIVTSGDYEQFYMEDSLRIHHIIDPHTGLPARKAISVSVIADDATFADAMCTALFVMGPKKGIDLANKLPKLEALFIFKKGEDIYFSTSKNFNNFNPAILDTTAINAIYY